MVAGFPARQMKRAIRLRNTFARNTFTGDLREIPGGLQPHEEFYGLNRGFIRASILSQILKRAGVDCFIETGTQRGFTSFLVAAQTRLPVFTCELDDAFFRAAWWKLFAFGKRVEVWKGDSREFIKAICERTDLRRPFFYLDAHRWDNLPLECELRTIMSAKKSFVIAIDDFKLNPEITPNMEFRFGIYEDQAIDLDYIRASVPGDYGRVSIFLPAYSSAMETGVKTGWVLIASEDFAGPIRQLCPPSLLRHEYLASGN